MCILLMLLLADHAAILILADCVRYSVDGGFIKVHEALHAIDEHI